MPGSLFSKVMSSGGGVVAGAALGRGMAGASYDFINDLIRLTAGIEKPSDTEDTGMRALVEMRNSAAFTTMAAGLGPLASYLRPVLGKVLGLGGDASGMSKLSDRCEERKNEAQALADKFNALNDQSKKLETEKAQVLEQFNVKNSQYAELVALVQEEEGVETPSEVVE